MITVPALSEDQVAALLRPAPKELVSMRLDADVIAWLLGFGDGYSTRANAILCAVRRSTISIPYSKPTGSMKKRASRGGTSLVKQLERFSW